MLPSSKRGMAIPFQDLDAMGDEELASRLEFVHGLGFGWLRFDIYWSSVEETRNAHDFSRVDRIVTAAESAGLRRLAVVQTMPDWLTDGSPSTTGPTTARERQLYAEFLATCVTRYGQRIGAWEVWNEPNLVSFWKPAPSVEDYVALLRQSFAAIKKVQSDATVLAGAPGGKTVSGDIAAGTFFDGMLAKGAVGSCDAMAVHPYGNMSSPEIDGELAAATSRRASMDRAGLRTAQLWGTETGAATAGPASEGHRLGDDRTRAEQWQAELWTATSRFWEGIHDTGPLFWYTLEDHEPGNEGTRQDHMGILRSDGSQKPVVTAMRA